MRGPWNDRIDWDGLYASACRPADRRFSDAGAMLRYLNKSDSERVSTERKEPPPRHDPGEMKGRGAPSRRIECSSPACRARFRVPESAVGRRVKSPKCQRIVRVPGSIVDKPGVGGVDPYRIRITHGPAFEGLQIELDPDRSYTFGKSDACDQQLPGPTVSR